MGFAPNRFRAESYIGFGRAPFQPPLNVVQQYVPHPQTLRGVAYSPKLGLAMVCGEPYNGSAVLYTSPNGADWTPQKSGVSYALYDAVWTGESFVAVGLSSNSTQPPQIARSTDGVTWYFVSANITTYNDLYGVASRGDGVLVAVGNPYNVNNAFICQSSSDGNVWGPVVNTLPNATLGGVCYGEGKFVAVGNALSGAYGPNVATSPDGLTWTHVDPGGPLGYNLADVTYSPTLGIYCACGGKSTAPLIMISADGLTWQQVNTPGTNYARRVRWVGEHFVCSMFAGAGFMTSTDGITWQQWTPPNIGTGYLLGVGKMQGRIITVGGASSGQSGGCVYTLDGLR